MRPFHLAIAVDDLNAAREFYGGVLGCCEGRSAERWVDFNLYGHQLVCHLSPRSGNIEPSNLVDGHDVPVPHYGVVLTWQDWETLAVRLRGANVEFLIEPTVRFAGEPGEQATMFFRDPAGNALEFKAMRHESNLFVC